MTPAQEHQLPWMHRNTIDAGLWGCHWDHWPCLWLVEFRSHACTLTSRQAGKVSSSILRSAQINCYTVLLKSPRISSHNHLLILQCLMSFSKTVKVVSWYSIHLVCFWGLVWAVPSLCWQTIRSNKEVWKYRWNSAMYSLNAEHIQMDRKVRRSISDKQGYEKGFIFSKFKWYSFSPQPGWNWGTEWGQ